MVDLDKFRQLDRRPCYVLRIAGLPVLYGTHTPFDLQTNGITHEKRAAIIPSGISFSRRIDENARIVEVGNLSLTLASDEQYTQDAYDPGKIFGRIGYNGADVFSRVVDSIESNASFIQVEDNSNFAVGDIVHIGLETVYVTSILTNNIIGVSRGILGTFPRFHYADEATGSYPYATVPLTYFRGRRVIVYEGIVSDDGTVSSDIADYIEVFRGFLATEPAMAGDGMAQQVKLELAPMTAILDRKLPTRAGKTKLHSTLHAFDGTVANRVFVGCYTLRGQMYDSTGTVNHGASHFYITDPSAQDLSNRFDLDIAAYHPRAMAVQLPFAGVGVAWVGPDTFDSSNNHLGYHGGNPPGGFYPQAINTQLGGYVSTFNYSSYPGRVRSAPMIEHKVLDLTTTGTRTAPEVVNWKHRLAEKFESDFAPGTIQGLNGFYFDVTIDPSVGDVFIKPNFARSGQGSVPGANILLSNNPMKATAFAQSALQNEDAHFLTTGIVDITGRVLQQDAVAGSFAPGSGSDTYRLTQESLPIGTAERPPNSVLPYDVLQLDDEDGNPRAFELTGQNEITTDGGISVPTTLANGWLHLGQAFNGAGEETPLHSCERYVVLENRLELSASGSVAVAIEKEDELLAIIELGGLTSVVVDGFTGYRYRIDKVTKFEDIATIADKPGEKPHTFRETIAPNSTSISQLILSLLVSLNGSLKTSSAFDTLSLGAGLSDGTASHIDTFGADLDIESFLGIPNPISAETFAPIYQEGDTILDIIEGMLNLVNYTVDVSTDANGKCRLRAVEIGLPDSSNIVRDFTTRDIAERNVPRSEAELSIKNVFKFSANHDHKGDAGVNLAVRDQVSVDLFNEAEDMSIDLKGVKIDATTPGDAVHVLQPVFAKLRLENSYPRRVFTFDVATSLLQQLALGNTCTITHPLMRSTSGLGITSEPARVRSIEYDGYETTGTIELVAYGVAGQSWNMSAQIFLITGSGNNVLRVYSNNHSPENNPSTGADTQDSTPFFVGQDVDIFSMYDMDAPFISTSITDISANGLTITVNDSCSGMTTDTLGIGLGFIVARGYAEATEQERRYAYIGRTTAT